jgi:exopolysaccharide production protein ExoQ
MAEKYLSIIRGEGSGNFIKIFNVFQKILFVFVLFHLSDANSFIRTIRYISQNFYIRNAVSFLTGTSMKKAPRVFLHGWQDLVSFSLDAAFWLILLMLVLRPALFARARKLLAGNWQLVALLLFTCASWFWSIAPGHTLNGLWLLIKISVIALYISQRYSVDEILDMLVWVIALGSILSILVIWLMPENGIIGDRYWTGIYSFKNYSGRMMAFGNAALLIYWLKNPGRVMKRTLAAGLFILTGVLLVYSDSATSLLGLLGMYAALVLYWMWGKWQAKITIRMRWLFAFLGLASFTLASWNYKLIAAVFNRSPTMSFRTLLWDTLWLSIQKSPVWGFGYQAFWQQYPNGMPVNGYSSSAAPLIHAHNGYIEIILALGFIGLILFLLFLITVWKRAILFISQKPQIIFIWPLLTLIYLTVMNIAYSVALGFPNLHWALFVLAAGMVSPSRPDKN